MSSMRTKHILLTLLAVPAVPAVLLAGTGCAATPSDDGSGHTAGSAWSYRGDSGPGHWGELADAYRACGAGERQSPIDLPAPGGGDELDVVGPGPVDGVTADDGHTVQFTAADGARTTLAGEDLDLVQAHVHAASEHTVQGEASAAEFHFVHTDAAGRLTVVGVLAERGAHNPAYDAFVAGATGDAGRTSRLDVESMLPTSRSFATYEGSLTTPPCTEGVRWIVLEQPVELGHEQLAALEAAHEGTARPVQPLGDRDVRHTL